MVAKVDSKVRHAWKVVGTFLLRWPCKRAVQATCTSSAAVMWRQVFGYSGEWDKGCPREQRRAERACAGYGGLRVGADALDEARELAERSNGDLGPSLSDLSP